MANLNNFLRRVERLIPKRLYRALQPTYHYLLSLLAAFTYRFPSRRLKVIAVTGTKGKTTVVELINSIFEEAGCKTAVSNTWRIKIGEESRRNLSKMSLPGRFFSQRFLREAVRAGCEYVILEITSEAAKQYRQKFIGLDALVFTNLAPEHIETHGSYEDYLAAKLEIAATLNHSRKKQKFIIVNTDDKEALRFIEKADQAKPVPYRADDAVPWSVNEDNIQLTFKGEKIIVPLSGRFNLYNVLAAMTAASSFGIETETIRTAIHRFRGVRGRLEKIKARAINDHWPNFEVIVDYAHTPDSLQQVYETFAKRHKICVLGSTGGGRDKWKRPVMGKIASEHCKKIFLTNEDPYDEEPGKIVEDIARGIGLKGYQTVIDRREAIQAALRAAGNGDVVIITGKGTDPYIMGPQGSRIPWDDAQVVREELAK